MYAYRRATPQELEALWNRNIAKNPGDSRWIGWKQEYLAYNQTGQGVTFAVVHNGTPVGEGTLLFSPQCRAINGRIQLADCCHTANINALRIRKHYEGRGHISALFHCMERYAASLGYTRLTIGVAAQETRNLAIYLHWGFEEFVLAQEEEGELILYYAKELDSDIRSQTLDTRRGNR